MRKIFTILIGLLIGAVLGVVTAAPSAAVVPAPPPIVQIEETQPTDDWAPNYAQPELVPVTHMPYHIKNNAPSYGRGVWVWANSDCTGSRVTIGPGDYVKSVNWDSFSSPVAFGVVVYDDKTHAYLTDKFYRQYECAPAAGNQYLVTPTHVIE